jgi:hypothetical protein
MITIAKRAATSIGMKNCKADSSRQAPNGGVGGKAHDRVDRPKTCANGTVADGQIRDMTTARAAEGNRAQRARPQEAPSPQIVGPAGMRPASVNTVKAAI